MANTNNPRGSAQPSKSEQRHPPTQPAAYFTYPAGKAVPVQNSELFKGKTFYVRCDFPDLYQAQFIRDIEALGGSTNVPDSYTADYVINNPPENDRQWQNELRRRLKAKAGLKPPIQHPYYWVYACHHAGEILSADSISEHPVFTKWDHVTRRPTPLLVYITVNLPKHGDEDGNEALAAVESTLERLGGFRSATRAHADVLILNLDTTTGQKFKASAKPDQVIWSRDEFETYARSSTPLDLGRDQQPREVVVARTNARSVSTTATGRRTSRKEFTAEDDDLVLRYIAAYDPEKKRMTSKSFYTEMMNSSNTNVTPWVHRHTAESWRERVKKRMAPFRLRVDAYLHDKVDQTLLTKEERETRSIPAALRPEPAHETQAAPRRSVSDGQGAHPPAGKTSVNKEPRANVAKTDTSMKVNNGKRSRGSADTVSAKDISESDTKRQKTTRKGTMPIDQRLHDTSAPDTEAGTSRLNGESSTRTRLKPRRSQELDVFDDHRDTPISSKSPNNASKRPSKGKQAVKGSVPAAQPYLAPASSPPAEEPPYGDKSLADLEQAMEDVIDEDSIADGQPDEDDAELEHDLLRHIARQEQQAATTRTNGLSSKTAGGGRSKGTQATEMTMSEPSISQVPDSQAAALDPSLGPFDHSQGGLQDRAIDLSVAMPVRIRLDTIQAQRLPDGGDGSVGSAQRVTTILAVGPTLVDAVSTSTSKPVQQTTATTTSVSVDQQTARGSRKPPAELTEAAVSNHEQARIRAQTDQEKREELKRIVVGLVEEYDLNYKAMHRLIEECRRRYHYVNQALLRGMIEQALAANAGDQDGETESKL